MEFTKVEHEAVSAAIREAKRHTSGQIICVLAQSSSDYAYVPILWTSVLALLVPWPLIDFTELSVQRIFLLQLRPSSFWRASFSHGYRFASRSCRARFDVRKPTGLRLSSSSSAA